MKTLISLAWAFLTLVTSPAGEVVTLITTPIVPQPPVQEAQSQSAAITLAEGDSAELSWAPIPHPNDYEVNRGFLRFVSGAGRTFDFGLYAIPPKTSGSYIAPAAPNPVKVSGPGTLKLVTTSRIVTHIATVTVTRSGSGTASNSVVIPQDPAGSFQVILESSADLITWTPVAPGTYSGSTAQRFFRTRIVKQ
jgi:hypothetical protein